MSLSKPEAATKKQLTTSIYAAIVVFFTYTLIFGFRKAFTAATFDGLKVAGYDYKTLLVISQIMGYMLAKCYGVKYIAELKRNGRGGIILVLTAIAWLSWLCFAWVPLPFNILFLFINGFPLGMLWGVVFSYVEGRRSTDFIGATLAVSFIFASGFARSVGSWLMLSFGISEFWMPFFAGLLFAIPLLVFVYLMERIPPPDVQDMAARTARSTMNAGQRRVFLKTFLPGLITCILIYTFATVFRDIRDNFGADMWKEMGYFNQPAVFSKTEIPITLIVLILIGSMVFIKNNYRALLISHAIICIGFLIAGSSTLLFLYQYVSPFWWMLLNGLGLYLVYIPFNAIFFERLIATFKQMGNVGFLIYLADSFGYVGSVGVLLSKEIFNIRLNWVTFFSSSMLLLSLLGIVLTVFSATYFTYKHRLMKKE